MEFYWSIKKNEILSFAGKWMELENNFRMDLKLARFRKPQGACFLSYVKYKPITNISNIMKNRTLSH
jgi:hypothetical protein